jgi:5-methylcytosine-specific restriction endonuclease McrA
VSCSHLSSSQRGHEKHSSVRSDPYKSALNQRNRLAVLDAAGWRCQICGKTANTADHVLPLALGGTHDLANLRALCQSRNSVLGARVTNEIKAARRIGSRSRRW